MRSFALIVLVATATACTSVDLKKPATRMMGPETSGEFLGGQLGVQLLGTANIKLVKEVTSSSPSTNPNIDEAQDFGVHFRLGMFPRMDAYYDTSLLGPNASGVKWQVLGNSIKESGHGNFALAIFAAPLWGSWDQEDTQNPGQANEVKAETQVSVNGYEAGMSLGYRFFQELMTYFTVYHSDLTAKAHVDQTDSGVLTQGLVRTEGEGSVQSLALGVILGRQLFIQAEGAYVIGEWKRTFPSPATAETLGNFMGGVNAGFAW